MATTLTLYGRSLMYSGFMDESLCSGSISIANPDPPILYAARHFGLSVLLARNKFPIRPWATIHWGQGKAAAELDCQRRLREMGR